MVPEAGKRRKRRKKAEEKVEEVLKEKIEEIVEEKVEEAPKPKPRRRRRPRGVLLDDIDKNLLEVIQEDGRISYRDLAKTLGVSVATAAVRAKRLESMGFIKRFTALLDVERLGYTWTAVVLLQIDGAHIEEVERELAKHPNVHAVYDVTGEYDAVLVARFKSREDLNAFIKDVNRMEHVKRTVTCFVLNVVKEDFRVKVAD